MLIKKISNYLLNLSSQLFNVRVLMLTLSAGSLLGYLLVVNNTNTLGYEIAEMKLSIRQLDKDYKDLQNKAIELSAMQRIEAISNSDLHMVNSGRVEYANAQSQTVAIKR